jgi:hypothetical protein
MNNSVYTEGQIIYALQLAEAETPDPRPVAELAIPKTSSTRCARVVVT